MGISTQICASTSLTLFFQLFWFFCLQPVILLDTCCSLVVLLHGMSPWKNNLYGIVVIDSTMGIAFCSKVGRNVKIFCKLAWVFLKVGNDNFFFAIFENKLLSQVWIKIFLHFFDWYHVKRLHFLKSNILSKNCFLLVIFLF